MINEYEGKTALLTGATGGLGRSLALQLVENGIKALLLSARSPERLGALASECKKVSSLTSIHCITADLSKPDDVDELARKALEISSDISILINNGGVSSRSRFMDTDIDVDSKVMQINFLSGARLAKAVTPSMIKNGYGRIIWISSVQGLVGIPNRSSYAASKFAVQGYCESIRAELASSGVLVHCISPGYIRTNLSQSALQGDGSKYGATDATTEAGADPGEVAATVLQRVARGDVDFCVVATTSALGAIWLRLLCPGILRSLLARRYEKSLAKEKTE